MAMDLPLDPVSRLLHRVNYSEADQMGVAYHARYIVWLDMARTEHLRRTGRSYAELEATGLLLAVGELNIRYRAPARYDDLVAIRCWVREVASRRVTFGYAVERDGTGELLATASTAMLALDRSFAMSRLPEDLRRILVVCPDPVRL